MSTLREHYQNTVVKLLTEQQGYKNINQVPKILKVTLNMGVGEAVADKQKLKHATEELEMIAGQKPVVTLARRSIAGFKIREGWPIGCKVTLRGDRMYQFLERFLFIVAPRIRDFRGLNPRSFDGHGNFSMGITEQIVFPEIDYEKIDALRGLDICVTTSADTDEEALALLRAMQFPFKKIKKEAA